MQRAVADTSRMFLSAYRLVPHVSFRDLSYNNFSGTIPASFHFPDFRTRIGDDLSGICLSGVWYFKSTMWMSMHSFQRDHSCRTTSTCRHHHLATLPPTPQPTIQDFPWVHPLKLEHNNFDCYPFPDSFRKVGFSVGRARHALLY